MVTRRRLTPKPLELLPFPACDETGPRIRVWRSRAQDCCGDTPHLHGFFMLVLVESGHGHQTLDGRKFGASPGEVFWIAPGQIHHSAGMIGTTTWTVAFSPEAVEPGQTAPVLPFGAPRQPWQRPFALASERGHCRMVLPPPTAESFRVWLTRLAHELGARPLGYASAARALLLLLLLDVARQVSTEDTELVGRPHRTLLEAIFRFIEGHYRRPIGLRDVAKAVGRSPAYLTDLVRRETGRPILTWITERRMSEARRLLLTSEDSTEQIAAAVGYGDPRHFSRQFRRLHGLPPQTWRKAQLAVGTESGGETR